MTYVEFFKNKLECCIAQKTAELILLNDDLIINKKLENDINLLNLFTVVISDLDCNQKIPDSIISTVGNICGSSICFSCDSDDSEIIIEEWDEDTSNYETIWVAQYECCECDEDYVWIPIAECCERDQSEIEI